MRVDDRLRIARVWFASIVSLLAVSGAEAQSSRRFCLSMSPASEGIAAMRVAAGRTVRFHSDLGPGCPGRDHCMGPSQLPAGAEVLVDLGNRSDRLVCAHEPASGAAGWLPIGDLTPIPDPGEPGLEDWEGRWVDNDDEDIAIDIRLAGGQLRLRAESFWPGRLIYQERPHDPLYSAATFDLSGKPSGRLLELATASACKLTLRRIGSALVLADNGGCGQRTRFIGILYAAPASGKP